MYTSDQPGWLNTADWSYVRRCVPIICVDLLPYRQESGGLEIGLIWRKIPDGARAWCLVGGRVFYNEPLHEAAQRHLRETLGPVVRFAIPSPFEATVTTEYFSVQREGELYDPRQHAVALVAPVAIAGPVNAGGEALTYKWFSLDNLPDDRQIGFGQARVIRSVIERAHVDGSIDDHGNPATDSIEYPD